MEINWSIVGWIIGLVFVYVFGLFEGRNQGYKRRKAEETREKNDQPPLKPETLTMQDPGLLRFRNENGAFTLDLDGAPVNPVSLSPEQRKRLVEVLNLMRPWLVERSAPAPSASGRAPAPAPINPDFTGQGRPAADQPVPAPPPPGPVLRAPKPLIIEKEDRPAAPANSMVTQIDDILQARLEGTALEERGIFLTQSPDGSVAVYVGLTRYSGIDEVPDAEIKTAIRAAIAEWEEKYTPGRQ
jgi:hypothetical protein